MQADHRSVAIEAGNSEPYHFRTRFRGDSARGACFLLLHPIERNRMKRALRRHRASCFRMGTAVEKIATPVSVIPGPFEEPPVGRVLRRPESFRRLKRPEREIA